MRFGIVGNAHAGKTTVAEMIESENYQIKHGRPGRFLKFADPLYEMLYAIGKPKNRQFMQEASDVAKRCFGEDVFVQKCYNEIHKYNKDDLLIIDDVRYPEEFKMLKEEGFVLIGIHVDVGIRRRRAEKAGIEFMNNHSSEQFVDELIEKCDYVIENTGNSEQDLKELNELVCKIVGGL